MLGATRTSGASPGGSSISGCGISNVIGPVSSTPRGQRRGYSSWGKVADQRELGADPAVEALDRRQAEPLALAVEVAPAVGEADVEQPLPLAPRPSPDRRPRRPQPDREEREPRLDGGVEVGDQRRARDPRDLGRERRREGEDVADDDVGPHLLEQRHQRPRRLGGVVAFGRVGVGRREHPVFLRRGEAEARRPRPPPGAPPRSRP